MRSIPLVDLRKQYEPLKDEVMAALGSVLDGMKLFLGENVFQLERDFAAFCGAKHAIGVGSGTDALHLALRALGVGYGDEVITAPNSFIATAAAIAMTGATPVFADIEPDTYTIDPAAIEAAITPRTKAIVPVHLYGHPADMRPIQEIASKHKLAVVEDACQAHGAEYEGRRAGTLGDAAAFSFYYSKNLGAYGEAGIVVSNNRALATRLQLLRNHGSSIRYDHSVLGMNSRLDEMQAAVLRIKLRYLDQWNIRRRALALEYDKRLADLQEVIRPVERPSAMHVYHLYVIRVPRRDELIEWLNKRGVSAAVHYPKPIHLQEATRHLGYREGDFRVAERVANEIISLPLYPELGIDNVNYICQTIADFLCKKRGSRKRGSPLPQEVRSIDP
jgi:dTDP-4-amino-4,6-dideoxygalactose transaminase